MRSPAVLPPVARYRTDPIAFIDEHLPRNEKGQPWRLNRYQRRVLAWAFRRDPSGRLLARLVLWAEPKKSGKSWLACCIGIWWALGHPDTEIVIASNDFEQGKSRIFAMMRKALAHNPALGTLARVQAAEILFANGTVVRVVAADPKGAAGGHQSLVLYDELWGFQYESAQRLFEELSMPPTEAETVILVVTYAGWVGESVLLEALYQRGLAGIRVDDDLECYEADDLRMFWSHTPRQPWQTPEYYAAEARLLRPGTFARLHRNEWVSGESALLTPELWDGAVVPWWAPADPDPELPVWLGGDVGVKDDTSDVEVVTVDPEDGGLVVLVDRRSWRPSRTAPIDLERTVEAYIRDVARRFRLVAGYLDPFQAHRTLTTLQRDGLPVREFPQTEGNTARMGETVYSLLKSHRLAMFPDPDLRQQAMNAVGVEKARGVRIAKASAARKVDGVVALAMACVAAVDVPVPPEPRLIRLGVG